MSPIYKNVIYDIEAMISISIITIVTLQPKKDLASFGLSASGWLAEDKPIKIRK